MKTVTLNRLNDVRTEAQELNTKIKKALENPSLLVIRKFYNKVNVLLDQANEAAIINKHLMQRTNMWMGSNATFSDGELVVTKECWDKKFHRGRQHDINERGYSAKSCLEQFSTVTSHILRNADQIEKAGKFRKELREQFNIYKDPYGQSRWKPAVLTLE